MIEPRWCMRVQYLIDILPQFLHWCVQYHVILDRVITVLDGIPSCTDTALLQEDKVNSMTDRARASCFAMLLAAGILAMQTKWPLSSVGRGGVWETMKYTFISYIFLQHIQQQLVMSPLCPKTHVQYECAYSNEWRIKSFNPIVLRRNKLSTCI